MKAPAATLVLEDRRFIALGEGSSLEHEWWVASRLQKAGLESIAVRKGETPIDFARRLTFTTLEGGVIYDLLGALMIPEGKSDEDWSPAMALETGAFLRKLRDPVAKARVQEVYLELLIPFVRAGIVRLYAMQPASSDPARTDGQTPLYARGNRTPGSGRGSTWWAPWLSGIRRAWTSSSLAGRWRERSTRSRPSRSATPGNS